MNETLTRTVSGVVYIILLVTATLYLNSFLLLFGVFMLIAVAEFCALVDLKKTIPFIISAFGYVLFSYFQITEPTRILLLIAALFISIKCLFFLFEDRSSAMDTLSKYVFLIGYIILPIIILTKIPVTSDGVYNPKIIISVFILIWANDTFAFVVGKLIGRRKLFERISPKKTIEGFVGGIVFAAIFSILIAKYFIFEPASYWIIISLIVSVFGTLGDLVQSKFKRIAGVKDSGKIMPGHGGILDRLDSIIFVAPFIFLFYQIINYVS